MCSRLRKRSQGIEKSLRTREPRQGMSPGSRGVLPTGHLSNRNRRDLLHHLLEHLHPDTEVNLMFRIRRTSGLDQHNLRVVWRKGVVSLLYAPNVVGTTQVFVERAPLVVSSVVRMDISCESVQRTDRVMRAIEHSLLQLLPQKRWYLEELLLFSAEKQTSSMQSTVAKNKRIRQMLSLV